MTGCCPPNRYDEVFDDRFARRAARRYDKKGLSRTAERMVAFVKRQGLEGASVLEIGGGVGEIQLELLGLGAARTTNLEVASSYEAQATRLAEQRGLSDRITRRHLDIAEATEEVETADVVILHRVVCCYEDYERLLAAAGSHAGRMVVFSHPPRHVASRSWMTVQNVAMRLFGKEYRAFTHPPDAMIRVLERQGLKPTYRHRGAIWQIVGLTR